MYELVEVQDVVSLGTESVNFLYPGELMSFDQIHDMWHTKFQSENVFWLGALTRTFIQ